MSLRLNSDFIDIQGKALPPVTDYLPEDLRKNWEQIWSCKPHNPEQGFIEAAPYIAARKKLWYTGWVTLVGDVGEGKSCTADHLVTSFVKGPWQFPQAQQSRDDANARIKWQRKIFLEKGIHDHDRPSYEPIWVTSPDEYMLKVDPQRPQIVVIDDMFGKACFNQSRLELWQPHLADMLIQISSNHPNTLVVVCVNRAHLNALPEEVSQLEWFRKHSVVDIKGGSTMPQEYDKNSARDTNSLVCHLQNMCYTFRQEGDNFLNNPWPFVDAAIDKVYRFDKIVYYTLAVTVVMDGKLDLTRATVAEYDNRTQDILQKLITILEVPEHIDLAKMRYAAKKLIGFFLQPDGEKFQYRITHEKVLQVCAKSMFGKATKEMLNLMSREFLLDHVRPSYIGRREDLMLSLQKEHFKDLGQRYTYEINSGFMKDVIQNQCFENDAFVKVWFASLKEFNSLKSVLQTRDMILNRSLFYWACYYGKGAVVREILGEGELAELRAIGWFQHEMVWGLQAACASMAQKPAAVVVKCLLDQGVNVNSREEFEGANAVDVFGAEMVYFMFLAAPPIHIAARRADVDTVKALIEHGASVTLPTKDGMTPLHRAASRCRDNAYNVMELLLRKGGDWRVKSTSGRTPLHEAFTSGCLHNIQALVDAGARLDDKMPDGRSFLSVAIDNEQRDVVDYLLYKVDVKKCSTGDNFSPLHHAVQKGDVSLAERLIEKGADMNSMSSNGWTALHTACFFAYDKMVESLINKGVDLNRTAKDGKTALHIAAMKGNFEICDFLIGKGAKTEAMCGNSDTPLVLAARGGHRMVVCLLLKEGMELETAASGGAPSGPHRLQPTHNFKK